MCQHRPRCPEWPAPDHQAARIVADQPRQGWSLLCNGVILSTTEANCFPIAVLVAHDSGPPSGDWPCVLASSADPSMALAA